MLTILFFNTIDAQNSFPPERIFVIANLDNNEIESTNFEHPNLSIQSKISWILKLDSSSLELTNPRVSNEIGKGWFLTYDFNTPTEIGIYKEQLQLRDNQLVITESRDAIMAKATNCNSIEFTNDERKCICSEQEDNTQEPVITYRLFNSSN